VCQLTGDGTRRRDVAVDGVAGVALGVMSQGELHSLALSLFVPRATLPESPFRFIVIDDPVQSMDTARVDGLARVLEGASADRQVVVFTHDDSSRRPCADSTSRPRSSR
jgi:wobble nucleotide-excising tRNase